MRHALRHFAAPFPAAAWLAGGLALAGLLGGAAFAGAQHKRPIEATPEQAAFFEKNVRPVLAANCYGCHSETAQLVICAWTPWPTR